MQSQPATRVIVTGVGGGSVGEQICKALRLGSRPYHIVATNQSALKARVSTADAIRELPPASAGNYLDDLLSLAQEQRTQFVIPGSEPELLKICQGSAQLVSVGINALVNNERVIATCLNKQSTVNLLQANGFRTPATFCLTQNGSPQQDTFPWVVKPMQGGGGSAATFVAQDEREFHFFVAYLRANGYTPLAQEYVGTADNEFTVGVLHSPKGTLLGTAVMRRHIKSGMSNRVNVTNRTVKKQLGEVLAISSGLSQGEMVDFAPVRTAAESIASAIGSTGPLNIQGRWDGERFIPFEINPRFSGTASLRALAGFNEPELLISALLGQEPPLLCTPQVGVCMRGLSDHFVATGGTQT
jgi:carbamoyl-phosphate synthase large subunit